MFNEIIFVIIRHVWYQTSCRQALVQRIIFQQIQKIDFYVFNDILMSWLRRLINGHVLHFKAYPIDLFQYNQEFFPVASPILASSIHLVWSLIHLFHPYSWLLFQLKFDLRSIPAFSCSFRDVSKILFSSLAVSTSFSIAAPLNYLILFTYQIVYLFHPISLPDLSQIQLIPTQFSARSPVLV